MKHRSSCCCCWLTLLLVGSSVIYVSPDSSTTSTTITFHHSHSRNSRSSTSIIENTLGSGLERYHFTTTNREATIMTDFSATALPSVLARTISQTGTHQPKVNSQITSAPQSLQSSSKDLHTPQTTEVFYTTFEFTTMSVSYPAYTSPSSQMPQQPTMIPQTNHFERPPRLMWKKRAQRGLVPGDSLGRGLARERSERDVELNDEGMDKCRLFTQSEEDQNVLYSPDYPNDYPKNINCTRIIEAPEGQLIRLDFRNSFNIEAKEDCKFDYLEIRDGSYGFSNLLGRYCGDQFPPMITSKERHLWLHFHSDESIEYSGFTAVYEFFDRPKNATSRELNCTIERDGFEGFINSTDVPQYIKEYVEKHKIPLDCMWRIKVNDNWKIQVKFNHFSLSKPNDCDTNFIDIFAEDTNIPSRVKNFCGSTGESVSSESNILHIRFYAEQIAMNSSFKILYTAFRDKGAGSCVEEEEYDCEDATCIAADLKCNGRDNCKFRWDEEDCKDQAVAYSEHVVIIIIVFGLILGGMVATFLVNCIRKIMRDQKIIREHIRQSKESKLNELGRSSKARSRDNLSVAMSPRQKHSQTSLQILDDVSNRFYREVVPISVQTSKADLKEHSILRNHHDMVVQTSLGGEDSSSPERGGINMGGNVCDMGCQTRESLFQPSGVVRQKSISSSSTCANLGGAIRFSTFGYDMQQTPPPPPAAVSTLSRHSAHGGHLPSESIELEERHSHHQHQHHHRSGGRGEQAADMPNQSRPQEICHHHHQHQQHLQQKHLQQQLQQQSYHQPMMQVMQPTQYHQQQQQQQQQHQHLHHSHHHQLANIGTPGAAPPPPPTSGKSKHQKLDESKVFIDIRNSAPDVIIMTSH